MKVNDVSKFFNDDEVEINIIRGNASDLGKNTDKAKLAVEKTIADIFFPDSTDIRRNLEDNLIPYNFNKKPIKQLFIEFLKKEEVIWRYINNWDKGMFPTGKPIKNPKLYLCAFCWWKVPEGTEFWQDIENKWLEYLEGMGR